MLLSAIGTTRHYRNWDQVLSLNKNVHREPKNPIQRKCFFLSIQAHVIWFNSQSRMVPLAGLVYGRLKALMLIPETVSRLLKLL